MDRRAFITAHRRWLPLLLAALLLAQTLGLVHRVLHRPGGGTVVSAADGRQHAFGHDDGDSQCRLYDQLAQGDLAFGSVTLSVAPALPAGCVGALPAGRLAPQAAGFLARGPPSITA